MLKNNAIIGVCVVLLAVVESSAVLASNFKQSWCPKGTVSAGDPAAKVRAYCGEPASIQRSEIEVGRQRGSISRNSYQGTSSSNSIPVEDWLYNFGPRESMKEMRFVDGELKNIRVLGYGY